MQEEAQLFVDRLISNVVANYTLSSLQSTWDVHRLSGVYPDPSQVAFGVMYGPTGTEYTGTYIGNDKFEIHSGRLIKPLTNSIAILI